MKKVISLLLALLLISTSAFATAVSCTRTEYGYTCTGGTTAGLVVADTWQTSTAYTVGQKVTNGGTVYKCKVAHTSGTFSTDNTAGKWTTGATAILWVTMMNLSPVGAATDTATFTSASGNVHAGVLNQYEPNIQFPSGSPNNPSSVIQGTPFSNLKVSMTAATDVLDVYIAGDNFSGPYSI